VAGLLRSGRADHEDEGGRTSLCHRTEDAIEKRAVVAVRTLWGGSWRREYHHQDAVEARNQIATAQARTLRETGKLQELVAYGETGFHAGC